MASHDFLMTDIEGSSRNSSGAHDAHAHVQPDDSFSTVCLTHATEQKKEPHLAEELYGEQQSDGTTDNWAEQNITERLNS